MQEESIDDSDLCGCKRKHSMLKRDVREIFGAQIASYDDPRHDFLHIKDEAAAATRVQIKLCIVWLQV